MKGSLFLFQWDSKTALERARELRKEGWKVEVESEDGARGGKKVLSRPPNVVVMDLARRPSHSRETADGLRSYKIGRNIPIVFVDGTDEDIRKTKAKVPSAVFTTSPRLSAVLNKFSETR